MKKREFINMLIIFAWKTVVSKTQNVNFVNKTKCGIKYFYNFFLKLYSTVT